MPLRALPLFIFAVRCLWAMVAATQRAAADARQGIPAAQRGGVSVFPVIPVFPLGLFGCAWLIDRVAGPWGTILVGAAHVVYAGCLIVSIVRDGRYLRSIDRAA
jgi:hypothetical protein